MSMITIKRRSGEGVTVTAPNGDIIYVRFVRKDGANLLCVAAPLTYSIEREIEKPVKGKE